MRLITRSTVLDSMVLSKLIKCVWKFCCCNLSTVERILFANTSQMIMKGSLSYDKEETCILDTIVDTLAALKVCFRLNLAGISNSLNEFCFL
jgi:hypothetical protein